MTQKTQNKETVLHMDPIVAAQNALQCVLEAKQGDRIVIFCDDTRAQIGKAFEAGALNLGLDTKLVLLETSPQVFRAEIPTPLTKHLTTDRPNIFINIFRGIREETPFRIRLIHAETDDRKTRLGHCPGVTIDMLTDGAIAMSVEEHTQMQAFAKALMTKLKDVVTIQIQTPKGTKLSFSVRDRPFFTDTMVDWVLMKWMNLPTGEVIVAPVEDSLEGKLICDVAVGGIGPIQTPVAIRVKKGKVDAVTCENAQVLNRVQDSLHTDAMAKVVGEFAFGINPKARFVEEFLEAEKIRGTVHIAFGDNTDFPGGKNNSANHMDFIMDKPTVKAVAVDGSELTVLADGKFLEAQPELTASPEEKLPISEVYKVVDYTTIFKSNLWWEAIVIFENYSRRQLGLYLWQKRNGVWKRKNKFAFRTLDEWNKIKAAIEALVPKLAGK
jgi:aminopeptidase